MLRLLAAATFALITAPTWAGGAFYDGNLLPDIGPRAEICYEGNCIETTIEAVSSYPEGAYYEYADNTYFIDIVRTGKDWTAKASFKDKPVDYSKLTCREIEPGSCFPVKP